MGKEILQDLQQSQGKGDAAFKKRMCEKKILIDFYGLTRTSGCSAAIVLVPDEFKIVSHMGVGNVTNIEMCD